MNKHSKSTLTLDRQQQGPKHTTGWAYEGVIDDRLFFIRTSYTPGKHAKPFAKHHPATPAIYNQAGNVVPLFPTAPVLDVAA